LRKVRQGALLLLACTPAASPHGVPGITHHGLHKPCRSADKVAPKALNLWPGDQTLTKAALRWEQVPSCALEQILHVPAPQSPGRKGPWGKQHTVLTPCLPVLCTGASLQASSFPAQVSSSLFCYTPTKALRD